CGLTVEYEVGMLRTASRLDFRPHAAVEPLGSPPNTSYRIDDARLPDVPRLHVQPSILELARYGQILYSLLVPFES
ncbi:MAG: hypothetical protein KJZ78_28910, partial [Bryobacteraceae bacterium]|nr:hypothetical protein [Bryobacteraceae bacterium]